MMRRSIKFCTVVHCLMPCEQMNKPILKKEKASLSTLTIRRSIKGTVPLLPAYTHFIINSTTIPTPIGP